MMRQITITLAAARTASGEYVKPEMKVWQAREIDRTVRTGALRSRIWAVSQELGDLEQLFPHAHNEHRHMINRKTGHCTNQNCWRFKQWD